MKPAWLRLLKEAIEYEKTRAIRFDTNIDYRAAILISLSRTGRLITPERLAGLEIYTDKDMENEQILDDIWERANLELDYQMITAKKGTRGPPTSCRARMASTPMTPLSPVVGAAGAAGAAFPRLSGRNGRIVRVAHHARGRSPRPRSPVRHRSHQDRHGAALRTQRVPAVRPCADGGLVPGE